MIWHIVNPLKFSISILFTFNKFWSTSWTHLSIAATLLCMICYSLHICPFIYMFGLLSSLGMLFSFHGKLKFKKVEVTRPWSHSWYTAAMQIQTSWLLVRCFWGLVFFFRFFSALKLPTLSTCLGKKTSDLGCDFLTPTFDN